MLTSERCGKCRLELVLDLTTGYHYHAHPEQDDDHAPILGTWVDRPVALTRDPFEDVPPTRELEVPPPAVPARPPMKSEVPAAAASMARKAAKAGWEVALTYAKGPLLNAHGTEILSPDAETIVIKGIKAGVGIFDATWLYRPELTDPKWAFDGAWISRTGGDGFEHTNTTGLRALIATEATS